MITIKDYFEIHGLGNTRKNHNAKIAAGVKRNWEKRRGCKGNTCKYHDSCPLITNKMRNKI